MTGLLIDCFKTHEYFLFRFWSQNHCLLFFFDSFFQKNLKSIAFSNYLRKGIILRNAHLNIPGLLDLVLLCIYQFSLMVLPLASFFFFVLRNSLSNRWAYLTTSYWISQTGSERGQIQY